ncbi:hypothetical protein U0070_013789 [Myodes glareolus]|uniref:HMG box domain-containing protein n=1 Tax=Myodes glareolus TaxID=447135 RepID=A0AAW0J9I3_MYOGA
MSSYAFFVQTCREEHKKQHPDASVNFSEFSKKCSEMWKTMSAKEKGKFEDMTKADKARYEREMKTYIPSQEETKRKFKDPNAPKRPPSAFFLFCSEYCPKSKENTLAYPLVIEKGRGQDGKSKEKKEEEDGEEDEEDEEEEEEGDEDEEEDDDDE